jgi:hypothetical protein
MNDERPVDAHEARAKDAVRGLPAPAADPAFRARLRGGFTSGTLAPAPRLLPQPLPRPLAFARAAMARAAAAFVVLFALDRAPGWQVTAWDGGAVTVDGQAVPAGDASALAARLHPGARVATAEGTQLALRGGDVMALVAIPGTEFTLPATPRRWTSRAVQGGIEHGEIRITTGPAFRGARLTIVTREAHVLVNGTTFAVIREPDGTCVCLYEGHVRMGPVGGQMTPLEPGNRRFVYNDGRPELVEPLPGGERMKLRMLRDAEQVPLGRPAGAPADTGAAVPPAP